MAKNQGQINFGIGFNVNTASLNNVRKTLKELRSMSKKEIEAAGGTIAPMSNMVTKSWTNDLGAMRKELAALEKAFEDAFNPRLGTYELNKFNESLQKSGTSAQRAFEAVKAYGTQGEAAVLKITTGMLATDRAARQVNESFRKLGATMMNTLRWTITSTAINTLTGSIQKAYGYAQDLDKSLNNIRIVTQKSAEDMEKFANRANKAAKTLGSSTLDYTDASLIYYQQGLSDAEVEARTDTTVKVAKITKQSTDAVSEQLTAVWNGYKVSAEEAELYVDKLSAVAATTAADLEELSTGMSKVASAANNMGVDIDQLNAMIATTVSVTRQAPESVGTAYKTIFARISDIEAGVDTETQLGEYTAQMAQMGFNVLDANGKLRDMGDVIEEIGNKWQSLTREQQVALAQTMAGTRQYNNLLALFEHWDQYQENLITSLGAAGSLSKQFEIYLEGTEAHMANLTAAAEGLYKNIFNAEDINKVLDSLTTIVTMVNSLVSSLGGMPTLLALAATLFTKIAKASIADLITKTRTNELNRQLYKNEISNGRQVLKNLQSINLQNEELQTAYRNMLDLEKQIYENAENIDGEQWNRLQQGIQAYINKVTDLIALQNELVLQEEGYKDYLIVEDRVTRTATGKRKASTINGKTYYLADENDTDPRGKKTNGLKTAELDYKNLLQQINIEEKKGVEANEEKVIELKKQRDELKNNIDLAKMENAERQKYLDKVMKSNDQLQDMKKSANAMYGGLSSQVNDIDFANKAANALDSFTSISFAIMGASSSLSGLFSGEQDIESVISNITGAIASLIPVISMVGKAIKAAMDAGKTFMQALKSNVWVLIIVAALTLVSTLTSAYIENQKQARETELANIEEAQSAVKAAKANLDLAQSYLQLYEAYKTNGEETTELITTKDQIIKKMEEEGLEVEGLANNYELLAKRLKDYQNIQYDNAKQASIDELNAAKNLLSLKGGGNIKGMGLNYLGMIDGVVASLLMGGNPIQGTHDIAANLAQGTVMSYGLVSSDEGKNIELLKDALGPEFYAGWTSHGLDIKEPQSPEEWVEFYDRLTKMTESEDWDSSGKSELNQAVSQILSDEELSKAVAAYKEAIREKGKLNVQQDILNLEDFSNIAELEAKKKEYIDQLVKSKFSQSEAESIINIAFQNTGGANASLQARSNWINAQIESGKFTAAFGEGLSEELSNLDNFSEADFSALDTIDLEDFDGTVASLIEKAKEKAKKIQEDAWSKESESRLTALDLKIETAKKQADKQVGKARAETLRELAKENGILKQQLDILEDVNKTSYDTYKNAKEDFKDLAEESNNYSTDLQNAISVEDWEKAQNIINSIADSDVSAALQSSLIKLQTASNEYYQSQEDIADKQEEIAETKVDAYEAEIDYLNNIIDKYQNMVDIFKEISNLYKIMYGDNDFSRSTVLYENMLVLQQASITNAKQTLDAALKELSRLQTETPTDTAAIQKQEEAALNAYSEYLSALSSRTELMQEALINNLNAVFETSAKQFTDGKSLGFINKEWEYQLKNSEKYLDEREKSYQIESLRKDVLQDILTMTNKGAQKQMTNLLKEQLKILEETDKLTEKDVARAQQKIDLLKAEIALEDARNNKYTMQLRRGTDGKYSYQYVADEAAIREAEKEKEEAEMAIYTSDKQAYEQSVSDFNQLYAAFAEEYTKAGDEKTRELVLEKYRVDMRDALVRNQQLLKTMQGYGTYKTDTSMQQWMTGLSEQGAFDSLISSLEDEVGNADIVKNIEDTNAILTTIYHGIQEFAKKDNIELPNLPASGKTGMYTGEWGSEGKIAILHEKELVLNANDTANSLQGIDILRSLNLSMMEGVIGLRARAEAPRIASKIDPNTTPIEQIVHITAEFPAAKDKIEIEQAFTEIVNLAIQHAYKK